MWQKIGWCTFALLLIFGNGSRLIASPSGEACEQRIALSQATFLSSVETGVETPIDVYVSTLSVNQGTPVNLTNGRSSREVYGEYGLDGSPDGRQIAFKTGFDTLSIMSVDGSGLRNFTYPHHFLHFIRWSPSGEWIATFMDDRSVRNSPFLLNLLHVEDGKTISVPEAISESFASMSWSPDSSMIIFSGVRNDTYYLYTVSLDDFSVRAFGGSRDVTDSKLSQYPEWSPNGKYIAFRNFGDDLGQTMYITDLSGSPIHTIPITALGAIRWSYDSRYIAFDDNRDIYILDVDTGTSRRLAVDLSASFIIAEERDPETGNISMQLVVNLPLSPAMGYDWSPDGYQLVVAAPGMWIVDVFAETVMPIPVPAEVSLSDIVWLNCPNIEVHRKD